jgi:hypothetical protein
VWRRNWATEAFPEKPRLSLQNGVSARKILQKDPSRPAEVRDYSEKAKWRR